MINRTLTHRILDNLERTISRDGLRVTARFFDLPPSTLASVISRSAMSSDTMDKIYQKRPEWFNNGPGNHTPDRA